MNSWFRSSVGFLKKRREKSSLVPLRTSTRQWVKFGIYLVRLQLLHRTTTRWPLDTLFVKSWLTPMASLTAPLNAVQIPPGLKPDQEGFRPAIKSFSVQWDLLRREYQYVSRWSNFGRSVFLRLCWVSFFSGLSEILTQSNSPILTTTWLGGQFSSSFSSNLSWRISLTTFSTYLILSMWCDLVKLVLFPLNINLPWTLVV